MILIKNYDLQNQNSTRSKRRYSPSSKVYNKARPGLGKEFTASVRQRASYLIANPLVCQIHYKEVHTAVIRQFPYMIHYTVNQKTKTIEVIAVLSTHMDPRLWDERS